MLGRPPTMLRMWTVIGAILSGLMLVCVGSALAFGDVKVQGFVVALSLAVCVLPFWLGRKLDRRKKTS